MFCILTKYLCKFHSFLMVKNEMLQSWYSSSSQIFYQLLHSSVVSINKRFLIYLHLHQVAARLAGPGTAALEAATQPGEETFPATPGRGLRRLSSCTRCWLNHWRMTCPRAESLSLFSMVTSTSSRSRCWGAATIRSSCASGSTWCQCYKTFFLFRQWQTK